MSMKMLVLSLAYNHFMGVSIDYHLLCLEAKVNHNEVDLFHFVHIYNFEATDLRKMGS